MYEELLRKLSRIITEDGLDGVEAVTVSHLLLSRSLARVQYSDEDSEWSGEDMAEETESEEEDEDEDEDEDEMEALLDKPESEGEEVVDDEELEKEVPLVKKPKFVA
jgi:hypothetical protein